MKGANALVIVLAAIRNTGRVSIRISNETIQGSDLCADLHLTWEELLEINREIEERYNIDMGEDVAIQRASSFQEFVQLVEHGLAQGG